MTKTQTQTGNTEPETTPSTPSTTPREGGTADTVIDEVRTVMARDGISQNQVAKESGVKQTTFNLFINGKYGADPKNIAAKLEKWLASHRAKSDATRAMPPARPWTSTPTSERILAALGYAQMAGDITIVYGAAGLGKTVTAREYARRFPNVWTVTASAARTCSVSMTLEEVLLALGVRELPSGAARMAREAVRKMEGSNGLLIIDEAQNLCVAALDEIRSLHDATGVGVAFLGNEVVYARMTGGSRAAYLDRLFSRIGKRVRLLRADADDIAAVAAAHGVRDAASLRLLAEIGARPGGLRSVVKTVRLALMMAQDGPLDAGHIRAAHRDLEGC